MHVNVRTIDDDGLIRGDWTPASVVSALARVVAVEGAADGLEQQLARIDVAELLGRGVARAVGQLLEQVAVQVPAHSGQVTRVACNDVAAERDIEPGGLDYRHVWLHRHLDARSNWNEKCETSFSNGFIL